MAPQETGDGKCAVAKVTPRAIPSRKPTNTMLCTVVRNVRTGEVSDEENEDIQLCVSVPAGDVALQL